MAYLLVLKAKKTGQVNGRGCADGRKQWAYTDKDEATSPTLATEALFRTAVNDGMEGRCVSVMDVPGAVLQAICNDNDMFYYSYAAWWRSVVVVVVLTMYVQLNGLMDNTLLEIDT